MKKVLVISGANRGIGFATAARFKEAGYSVINISRRVSPSKGVTPIIADLSLKSFVQDIQQFLQKALSEADEIVLIHNAAVMYKDSVNDVTSEAFQTALQVNIIAPSQLNQLCLPMMKEGSSILYLGSTLSEKAVGNSCTYVTSKHAILGLMRSTVQDLAGRGIHSACVCPGFTNTEMLRDHLGDRARNITDIVSFKRLLEPSEIADTLFFCAQTPALNGAVLHANLGQIES